MGEIITEYYIIQKKGNNVLKISPRYFYFRDAISAISSMYENWQYPIIKVYKQNFTYLNEKGEEIDIKILPKLPEYLCGLHSDNLDIMKQLIKMRE